MRMQLVGVNRMIKVGEAEARECRMCRSMYNNTVRPREMKTTDRTLWIVFAVATLSPILALAVKPAHYSFYMFLPATPDTVSEVLRLIAADIILVAGFIIGLIAAAALAWRGLREKRLLRVICLVAPLANPLHQPIFLESLDTRMNYRWRDKAEQMGIVGKTSDEILYLLGKPSYEWTETPRMIDRSGNVTWQGETVTGWDYHVMPFYWLGSKFQVFFVDGKVRNFEANDD